MKRKFKSQLLNLLSNQFKIKINNQQSKIDLNRRKFLTNTSIAALGIGLSSNLLGSCTSQVSENKVTVAILGGGIAGLHAAHILSKYNVDFKIFESSNRIGGRIFTAKNIVADGITTELGGEFIDSNHEDMLNLVKEFNLELLDFEEDVKNNNLIKDTYFFDNKHYTEKELISQFEKYVASIEKDLLLIDEENEDIISQFDHISITDYLKSKGMEGWLLDMLVTAFTGEYGLEASEQSSLNLLYMLSTDTKEGFKVYGDSDERYKIKGGNDLLISKLAEKFDSKILKQYHCISISEKSGTYELSFKNDEKYIANFLIVAIPFTALRKIELKVNLPEEKVEAIQQLGYGTNSKVIFGFNERPWRSKGYSGYLFNSLIHNGWDSSELQNKNEGNGAYTVFLGGKSGKELSEENSEVYFNMLTEVFENVKETYNSKKTIFNWSTSIIEGSYSAYKVGQWSTIAGNEQIEVGNMFFAGEHCSENFQGYMNGGAETGRVAAEKIIKIISEK